MKTYSAIIANNGKSEVISVNAKNLTEAKIEASKQGQLIMIGLDKVGSATHF